MEIGALPIRQEIEEPEGYVLTPRVADCRMTAGPGQKFTSIPSLTDIGGWNAMGKP